VSPYERFYVKSEFMKKMQKTKFIRWYSQVKINDISKATIYKVKAKARLGKAEPLGTKPRHSIIRHLLKFTA